MKINILILTYFTLQLLEHLAKVLEKQTRFIIFLIERKVSLHFHKEFVRSEEAKYALTLIYGFINEITISSGIQKNL